MEFQDHYDVMIVGGGIVGAGLFRDLSLHDVHTLIVDAGDFASQTTQSSSKMLHGGIRYLEHMDFDLIHEALHEKNLWLESASHLCYETSFVLPVFENSPRSLPLVKGGLFIYDLLSKFQNSRHRTLTVEETLKYLPGLKTQGLKGAGLYYDAIIDDARLCLEVILDGLKVSNYKNTACNYMTFENIHRFHDRYLEVEVFDRINQVKRKVTVKDLIFATGPFTDQVLGKIQKLLWRPVLVPSKGSHLWIRKNSLKIIKPMTMTHRDGRIIFIIPQRDKILVGTTEVMSSQAPFNLMISKEEIHYLLEAVNNYFPRAEISEDDILSTFAGTRPLVREGEVRLQTITRKHKIFRPQKNIYCIVGGKLTTFRTMGQEITREICLKRKISYSSRTSRRSLSCRRDLFKDRPPNAEELESILKDEFPRTFQDLLKRRMGFASSKHWNFDIDFKDYFTGKRKLIGRYFKISDEDIDNY